MDEVLSLVIGGPACKQIVTLNAWFEWLGSPQVQRLGWLNVVVPVDHEMRFLGFAFARGFCQDNGVAAGFDNACFESNGFAMVRQPGGGVFDILVVGGLRRHTGNS